MFTMDPKIPGRFANVRHVIEQLYKADDTFREIYDDYLTSLKTYQFWARSSSDDAAVRQSEYAVLSRELEEELMQMLNADEFDMGHKG
jgi:hypothetical protein